MPKNWESRFKAVNISAESENKIHADDEARRYGFKGGLVPGIGTFAYACEALREHTSPAWLEHGYINLKYSRPVYDGDTITVSIQPKADNKGGGSIAVINSDGTRCAEGGYAEEGATIYRGRKPRLMAQQPSAPKQMLGSTLVDLEELSSVTETVSSDAITEFMTSLGLDPTPYLESKTAPIAYIARLYVTLMRANFVRVGPSIHAGTELQVERPIRIGETLSIRSRVDSLYRRAGQNYWSYETGYFGADDLPAVWTVQHAVYQVAVKELSDVAS